MTQVVNLLEGCRYDVYVGRKNVNLELRKSEFAVPWHIIATRWDLEHKRNQYAEWLARRPWLIKKARWKLRGKVIGVSSRADLNLVRWVLIPIIDAKD